MAVARALVAISRRTADVFPEKLMIGHVNHGLRGEESDQDEKFVARLAEELKTPFRCLPAYVLDSKRTPSEEMLREIRYKRLLELANDTGARYLVTGHNFDDQVETILFRIFRGTGIAGLAGIPKYRLANESVTLVRPLLQFDRQQISDYLREINQPYRVDHSNSESTYTRNYLRNSLLPELRNRFGDAVPQSLARLGEQAREIDEFLTCESEALSASLISRSENQIEIDCHALQQIPDVLIRQFMLKLWKQQNWPRKSMTSQWWQRICEALCSDENAVYNLPCFIRFEKWQFRAQITQNRPREKS